MMARFATADAAHGQLQRVLIDVLKSTCRPRSLSEAYWLAPLDLLPPETPRPQYLAGIPVLYSEHARDGVDLLWRRP